jgi:hypothetical protein
VAGLGTDCAVRLKGLAADDADVGLEVLDATGRTVDLALVSVCLKTVGAFVVTLEFAFAAVGRGGGGGGAARDVAERLETAPLDNDDDNDALALNLGGALPVEREPSWSPKLLKKSSDVSAIFENNFNSIQHDYQHARLPTR